MLGKKVTKGFYSSYHKDDSVKINKNTHHYRSAVESEINELLSGNGDYREKRVANRLK